MGKKKIWFYSQSHYLYLLMFFFWRYGALGIGEIKIDLTPSKIDFESVFESFKFHIIKI